MTALKEASHPNLVPIDSVERSGRWWVVEEPAHGTDLGTVLDYLARNDLRATSDAVLHVCLCLCDALEALHAQWADPSMQGPLLHLAISPRAVRVSREGQVQLGSYDLLSRGVTDVERLRHYGAPEQLSPDGKVGGRADLFSMGVVLFEMLTNERAFATEARPELSSRLDDLAARRDATSLFAPLLRRLLVTHPKARYATVGHLRQDLLRVFPKARDGDSHREGAAALFGAALGDAPSNRPASQSDAPVDEVSEVPSFGTLEAEMAMVRPGLRAAPSLALDEQAPPKMSTTIIPGLLSREGLQPRMQASHRLRWWPLLGAGLVLAAVTVVWLAM
ncbi:MAG: hypothetical protein KTR31_40705 [Myxococcales bacterium]|nr:hypothetical protein [Myxococcales bacterium]